jgi:hypothetical protein
MARISPREEQCIHIFFFFFFKNLNLYIEKRSEKLLKPLIQNNFPKNIKIIINGKNKIITTL